MENPHFNPVIDNILARRSIRRYTAEPVEVEKILSVLQAMQYAPSGHDRQSWHFTAITNSEVLEKLRVMARDSFRGMDAGSNEMMKGAIQASEKDDFCFFYNAPCLIVASNLADNPNAMADCACALENAMLAAESLGLGSCWINQLHWLDGDAGIRKYLAEQGIPEENTVCGSVILGYSAYSHHPEARPRRCGVCNLVK